MFFQPWAIFGSLTHCVLGVLRGKTEGTLVLKALCLSVSSLFIAGIFGRPFASFVAITLGFTFVPAALGLWLRRSLHRSRPTAPPR